MHGGQIVWAVVADVGVLQHAKRHQRGDALTVWRDLVQFHVVKALADGAAPVVVMRSQIVGRHRAAIGLGEGRDLLRDLAFVEGAALGFGDGAQGACGAGVAEAFAGFGRASLGHESLGKAGLVLEHRGPFGPRRAHDRRHDKAVFGIADRGGQHGRQAEAAEFFRQFDPGADGTGDGHGVPAVFGDAVLEILGRPGSGRAARGVQPVQLLAVPQDAEGVRAKAAARGLDDC